MQYRSTALLVCLLSAGCASLKGPREATALAYRDHITRISELNNYDAEEGIRLLDAAPATEAGRMQYGAAIDAHRKACDFAKGLLAKSLKSIEGIRATLGPVKP